MESEFFRLERDGAVAHLVMARPDKANAMNEAFWADLPRMVAALEADRGVRALVISGEGKHFTSGMDLGAFAGIAALVSGEPGRGAFALREMILRLQAALSSLERARFPVICAIHGACIGGGIDMITAADIRLAARDAVFAVEEINIGMAADVGTLQRLPRLIAPGVARELCLTGRRFTAEEAQGWGLVNALHDGREGVVAAALALAAEIAAKSPLAIAGIKRAMVYAADHPVADGLEQIATWNAGTLRAADLQEAIQARAAKRKAIFADMTAG
ncbi:crotonase/enoyl-CoA hydratase family protein [Pikeienuella piscinae]|uniref:Crotonase/enoyl-CoA hydratase family protein n=1 Tax=Pikeienuella piscinae TaxID=2748098 RepID=A0A7L5BYA3_9RHOB|nr:crotonase/enoyl-CoA hydratase family protein [Pikeienuella piscinae]QIE55216.1 crotonase/enoyl-CoA hydratase family protein [Pikeienuella piscinae]